MWTLISKHAKESIAKGESGINWVLRGLYEAFCGMSQACLLARGWREWGNDPIDLIANVDRKFEFQVGSTLDELKEDEKGFPEWLYSIKGGFHAALDEARYAYQRPDLSMGRWAVTLADRNTLGQTQ